MFRIGEFSRIARVSGRLMRYYDQIGLLKPDHVDRSTGYRYYSAAQLPRLNRILALKDLGLTLDQVGRMIDDNISTDEIKGMLLMRRAEVEQTLDEETARLDQIEARLAQIDTEGKLEETEVVVKPVPRSDFLSVRDVLPKANEGFALVKEFMSVVRANVDVHALGPFVGVMHSDAFENENFDFEVGYCLNRRINQEIPLSAGRRARMRELPGVETMATLVHAGAPQEVHAGTAGIGRWMEANGYRIAGPNRELFLEGPFLERMEDSVIEMQFPVEKAVTDANAMVAP